MIGSYQQKELRAADRGLKSNEAFVPLKATAGQVLAGMRALEQFDTPTVEAVVAVYAAMVEAAR